MVVGRRPVGGHELYTYDCYRARVVLENAGTTPARVAAVTRRGNATTR